MILPEDSPPQWGEQRAPGRLAVRDRRGAGGPAGAASDVPAAPGLRRVLGFRDVVLFLVAAVVSTRWIAAAAAAGPSALALWVIAFLALFVPLGLTVLELSSRHPDEGGIYVWVREAFGSFAGFMTAWMYWASNLVYFPGLLYFVAANALFVGGPQWLGLSDSAPYFISVTLGGIAIAFALHLVGLNVDKWLHNAGAVGTWMPVAMLIAVGAVAWVRGGPAIALDPAAWRPHAGLKELTLWSSLAFAFAGLEVAPLLAGEIVAPRRTLPRALLAAGALITATYVLGTLAILVAMPGREASGLQGILQAIQVGGARVGLPAALAPAAAALITVGGLGQVAAWLAGGARLPFVAGIDRLLPPAFARTHPRWGTPWVALLVQALGAALFALLGQAGTSVRGAYDALVSMTVIAYFVPYLLMFAALIRIQGEPAGPQVIRVPGGRPAAILVGALGMISTAVSIAVAVMPPPGSEAPAIAALKVVGSSLLLAGGGALLYGWGSPRRVGRA